MIPNIFISSTIADLHYLRDNIRNLITEMGYNPILSEYGGVGYVPWTSAVEACYKAVSQCQLAVVIIGRRYGAEESDGTSITQHEFRTAKERGIPTIHLVEAVVLTSKTVYEANQPEVSTAKRRKVKPVTPINFPGMDSPEKTFAFVSEISEYPKNNGVLKFSNVDEARTALKQELAGMSYAMLTERFDPVKEGIKDILAEVKTLRHELSKGDEAGKDDSLGYVRAARFMLDESNKQYRSLASALCGGFDESIPILLRSRTFEDFLKNAKATLEVRKLESLAAPYWGIRDGTFLTGASGMVRTPPPDSQPEEYGFMWGVYKKRKVIINSNAKKIFDKQHDSLMHAVTVGWETPKMNFYL